MLQETTIKQIKRMFLYKKKNLVVKQFSPMDLTSYWDGPSRDYYHLVNLRTLEIKHYGQNGGPFGGPAIELKELPEDSVLVNTSVFCGSQGTMVIYHN